jgi:serine/threonine protein kinase
MGHVFRALDTRLDRQVAIKVLPQQRWSDPEFRQRFEREARAISSLSHPNLCALYDVGEVSLDGVAVPYLVMELLEGETLRDRIEAGAIPTRKALAWAAQIATGLAAAHEKGLIHRDLKPENVFITRGEQLLKILDFGLAKATQPQPEDSTTALHTDPGMVMGTAHYMSPEQVRGTNIDHRSDLFSLGVVLYEMLTGRVPFRARSAVETMNAILVEEPPAISVPVPEHVEALVWRCLEKDPSQRFASARDLAFALDNAAKSLGTATPEGSKTPRVTRSAPQRTRTGARLAIMGVVLGSILLAAALARGVFDEDEPEPPRLRTLTYSGRDSQPAASRDGRLVAFVSTRDGRARIWIKQLADGSEAALTAGPDDSAPRFSPDGSMVLFTRQENGVRALYRVPLVGGEPRKLIDNAFDGDLSPDGRRVAFVRNRQDRERTSTVCVAQIGGGSIQEIAASKDDEFGAPRWSPDGRWIAVTRQPRGTIAGSIVLIDQLSGERRILQRKARHGAVSAPAWTRDGDAILYAEMDAITSRAVQRRGSGAAIVRYEIDGGPRVLLRNPHAAADTLDLLGDGRIVFTEDVTRQNLQLLSLATGESRWLSRGMSTDRQPSYARGGQSVLFTSDRGGNVDIWELTIATGALRRLTDHDGVDWDPHASADGTTLFFSSNRGGHFEVWSSTLDGVNPQQLTRDGVDAENPSTPASGDWIFYDSTNPKSDGLWRIPRGGGKALLVAGDETIHPEVSADGQYVAYQRPEPGGPSAVQVVRVSDGAVFTLASRIAGIFALRVRWIGATHTIAYRALDEHGRTAVFAQDFVPGQDTRDTRRQLTSTELTPETYAISPDGKQVIVSVIDEASGLMIAEGID